MGACGNEIARFGKGHSFVSAFVENEELNVFALEFSDFGRVMNSSGIDRIFSTDMTIPCMPLHVAESGVESAISIALLFQYARKPLLPLPRPSSLSAPTMSDRPCQPSSQQVHSAKRPRERIHRVFDASLRRIWHIRVSRALALCSSGK